VTAMLPFDLAQYSETARNDLCMTFYRSLEKVMATAEGREYIEEKTAERLAQQKEKSAGASGA